VAFVEGPGTVVVGENGDLAAFEAPFAKLLGNGVEQSAPDPVTPPVGTNVDRVECTPLRVVDWTACGVADDTMILDGEQIGCPVVDHPVAHDRLDVPLVDFLVDRCRSDALVVGPVSGPSRDALDGVDIAAFGGADLDCRYGDAPAGNPFDDCWMGCSDKTLAGLLFEQRKPSCSCSSATHCRPKEPWAL
jgi:hypothetical protein